MTTPDTEALRRVAEAATPGPWGHDVADWHGAEYEVCQGPDFDLVIATTGARSIPRAEPDAAYIATFDPPTVLALLDERDAAANRISELEARVGVLEGALTKIADGKVPPDMHGHYLAHREAVKIARAALTPQEKDQGR